MEARLIELVRQYEVLYNVNWKDYRDQAIRQCAWEEIATKLNWDVTECKDAWARLRNCFSNALKRQKKKIDQGGTKKTLWKYEKQMAFILPYMESRSTPGKIHARESKEECYSPGSMSDDQDGNTPSNNILNNSLIKEFTNRSLTEPSSSRKRSLSFTHFPEGVMKMPPSELQEPRLSDAAQMDATDLFFLSMGRSLKKLPKVDQTKIKMDLHQAIAECELRQLQRYEMMESGDETEYR